MNLARSSTVRYEWMLAGTQKNRGLCNSRNTDDLEYGERTFGINLKWQFHEVADQNYVEPPDYERPARASRLPLGELDRRLARPAGGARDPSG